MFYVHIVCLAFPFQSQLDTCIRKVFYTAFNRVLCTQYRIPKKGGSLWKLPRWKLCLFYTKNRMSLKLMKQCLACYILWIFSGILLTGPLVNNSPHSCCLLTSFFSPFSRNKRIRDSSGDKTKFTGQNIIRFYNGNHYWNDSLNKNGRVGGMMWEWRLEANK